MHLNCSTFLQDYHAQKEGSAILLDVRNQDEVQEGALDTMIHIPLSELAHRSQELPKEKAIYIYCRSGNRAKQAYNLLQELGFKKLVCAIEGGYSELKQK